MSCEFPSAESYPPQFREGTPADLRANSRNGFGTRVAEEMIRGLNGEMRLDWRSESLVCEIAVKA